MILCTSQLETYFKKWITVKNEVTEILRKTDSILLAEKKKAVSTSSIQVSPSGAEYIRFNSAVELKPAFLECYCTMLTVNQFIDQKFHYISSGFKNKYEVLIDAYMQSYAKLCKAMQS